MDLLALYQEARAIRDDVTVEQVASILASIDRASLEAAERAQYDVRPWDKRTPINGAAPEYIIQSYGVQPDDVPYLICRGQAVVYFQPSPPGEPPCKSEAEAVVAGNRQVEELVRAAVDQQVRQQVLRRVLGLLRVTSDKQIIYANGQDTATVTASSIDLQDGDQVTFNVPGAGSITVTASGGKAVVPFTTTVPGDWPVTASHPTLGSATVLIRGV